MEDAGEAGFEEDQRIMRRRNVPGIGWLQHRGGTVDHCPRLLRSGEPRVFGFFFFFWFFFRFQPERRPEDEATRSREHAQKRRGASVKKRKWRTEKTGEKEVERKGRKKIDEIQNKNREERIGGGEIIDIEERKRVS